MPRIGALRAARSKLKSEYQGRQQDLVSNN
jgi:hypothetical protein